MIHDPLSERILGRAFQVSTVLGIGFSEKVYENALVHELRKAGLQVDQQKGIEVWYDDIVVGQFVTDLLVEKRILIEIKAERMLEDQHLAQALNYLRATGLDVCLLINFGTPKPEIRRLVPGRNWGKAKDKGKRSTDTDKELEPVRNGEEQ